MKAETKVVAIRALNAFWQSAIAYLVATFGTQMAGVDVFDIHALANVIAGLLIGVTERVFIESYTLLQSCMNSSTLGPQPGN